MDRPFQDGAGPRTAHYYATVQLAAGLSTLQVSRQLGHKDDHLVSSTYGHLFPEATGHARAASAGAWAQARAEREAARRGGLPATGRHE